MIHLCLVHFITDPPGFRSHFLWLLKIEMLDFAELILQQHLNVDVEICEDNESEMYSTCFKDCLASFCQNKKEIKCTGEN